MCKRIAIEMEDAKAVKDRVGDVDAGQAQEMVSCLTAPVAGDMGVKVIYFFTVLAGAVLFLYSLASVAPTWADPVTSVQTVQATELPFPDIYMCYESEFVDLFSGDNPKISATYVVRKLDGEVCEGLAGTPSLAQAQVYSENTCFVQKTESSLQQFTTTASDQDGNALELTIPHNAKAQQLAELMPKTGSSAPVCYAYPANGAKLGYEQAGQMAFLVWGFEPNFDNIDAAIANGGGDMSPWNDAMEKGAYTTMYLVEAGGEVVKDGKATVPAAMFPAFGTFAVASMDVDLVRDDLAGDTKFNFRYRASVTSFPDSASHYFATDTATYVNDMWTMVSIFKIHSFTVNKIHIRSITFGEIWSAIGGMWGGAALIMGFVFTGSGYIRSKDQKELLVFRFQSTKSKKKVLKAAGGHNKGEEEEAERKAVRDRVARLEAKLEMLTTMRA